MGLDRRLPVTLLARYLFFLSRRKISRSNQHFLARRLAGLKSLMPFLADSPALTRFNARLEALTPGNFSLQVESLLDQLKPVLPSHLAPDIVVSRQPPGEEFLAPVRRITLIFGPGIGVGDEILCFTVPDCLRQRLPAAEITVLSAYPDLWSRVAAVDHFHRYHDYDEIVSAIRGQGPAGAADLVMLIDFEKPALTPAIAGEAGVRRYVELSLGARSIVAFDSDTRCLHNSVPIEPYLANYYDSLEHFLHWLGGGRVATDRRKIVDGQRQPPDDQTLTFLVSPFTSKKDPMEAYWSRLLAGLVPPELTRRSRLLIDPGPNLTTERFASALARAATAQGGGLRCEVAREEGKRTLPLDAVFRQLEQTQVVICADSFAAHAAPLFGCLTLVVAPPGLGDWRVPAANSYYFDQQVPVDRIAAAMRRLIAVAHGDDPPWIPPGGGRLIAASRALTDDFANGATPETLKQGYDDFSRALHGMVASLDQWPQELATLATDRPYRQQLPTLALGFPTTRDRDLRLHLESHFRQWHNSNLCKYLERAVPATGGAEVG